MRFRESHMMRIHTFLFPWEWRPAVCRLFRTITKRPCHLATLLAPLLRQKLSSDVKQFCLRSLGASDAHRWALAFAECGHLDSLGLLAESASRVSVDAVKLLLRIGANPDGFETDECDLSWEDKENQGQLARSSPLYRAICARTTVAEDQIEVCSALIDAGCETQGAAKLCCVVDNITVLKLFSDDIDASCMHAASAHGACQCLRHMVSASRQLDLCLHRATKAGQVEAVSILLEAKADPNGVNNEGQTPLGIATRRSGDAAGRKVFPQLSKLLRGAGASLGQFNPTLYG